MAPWTAGNDRMCKGWMTTMFGARSPAMQEMTHMTCSMEPPQHNHDNVEYNSYYLLVKWNYNNSQKLLPPPYVF